VIRYQIELTKGQLAVVQQALDLYERVHMGQWSEVAHVCYRSPEKKDDDGVVRSYARTLLDLAASMWTGLSHNASFGIASERIADEARVACDIYRTVRHHLWKDRPESECTHYTVDAYDDSPLSDEPKPTVRTLP
jgi:hypothetical protein